MTYYSEAYKRLLFAFKLFSIVVELFFVFFRLLLLNEVYLNRSDKIYCLIFKLCMSFASGLMVSCMG